MRFYVIHWNCFFFTTFSFYIEASQEVMLRTLLDTPNDIYPVLRITRIRLEIHIMIGAWTQILILGPGSNKLELSSGFLDLWKLPFSSMLASNVEIIQRKIILRFQYRSSKQVHGAGTIAQWVGCLLSKRQTWVWSLPSLMVPRVFQD